MMTKFNVSFLSQFCFFITLSLSSTESQESHRIRNSTEYSIENRFLPFLVRIEKLDKDGKVDIDIEGVIISDHWILSAGFFLHDREASKEQYRIIYKTMQKFEEEITIDRIERIVQSDPSTRHSSASGLALYYLNASLPLGGSGAQAINLNRHHVIKTGDKLRIYGIDYRTNRLISRDNITAVGREDCIMDRKEVWFPADSTEFCSNVDLSEFRYDDTGGPIIVKKNGKFLLAGIPNHGYDERQDGSLLPAIHHDIRSWIGWIEGTVKNHTKNWKEDYLASRIHKTEELRKPELEGNKEENEFRAQKNPEVEFDEDERLYHKDIIIHKGEILNQRNIESFAIDFGLNIALGFVILFLFQCLIYPIL